MQKRPTGKYFSFTRKERNGTIFLLIIILLLTAIPFIYPLLIKEKIIHAGDMQYEMAILKTIQKDSSKKIFRKNVDDNNIESDIQTSEKTFHYVPIKRDLFYFDPNTISTDQWKRLGLRDKTINTIQHFIAKGGKFRQPEDIKKIWGLHEDEVLRLMPFVKIAAIVSLPESDKKPVVFKNYEHQKKSFEKIDINLADTSAFIRLPGIGSKLSNRIISFREKLGGFYSIDQISETFGLPDSVFQKIRPSLLFHEKNLTQLNINTASKDELKQHPYIRYNLANLIVQYRTQHGNFTVISEIKNIMIITEELYNKLFPYLTID